MADKKESDQTMSGAVKVCLTIALVLSILSIDQAVNSQWPSAFYLLAWAFCAGAIGRKILDAAELATFVPAVVDLLTDRVLDRVLERIRPGINSPRNR